MAITKLSASGVVNFVKYRSMLAGNPPYEPPSPSSYDLLETQVLTSSAASVTFTGLGSYTDYKHLQIRAVAGHPDVSTAMLEATLRFNGDSGLNYARHYLYGNGSNVSSSSSTSQSRIRMEDFAVGDSTSTSSFAASVIDILDFSNSSINTTVRRLGGGLATGEKNIQLMSGAWFDTSAVTSLTIGASSGSFISGSRFSLYGIKGA